MTFSQSDNVPTSIRLTEVVNRLESIQQAETYAKGTAQTPTTVFQKNVVKNLEP